MDTNVARRHSFLSRPGDHRPQHEAQHEGSEATKQQNGQCALLRVVKLCQSGQDTSAWCH